MYTVDDTIVGADHCHIFRAVKNFVTDRAVTQVLIIYGPQFSFFLYRINQKRFLFAQKIKLQQYCITGKGSIFTDNHEN
jgi:hypothetical protein